MVADFWSGLDPTDPTGSAGPVYEACAKSSSFFLKQMEDGTLSLKPTHDYYYQVNRQMFVDRKTWFDFVAQTNINLFIQWICWDQDFWSNFLSLR